MSPIAMMNEIGLALAAAAHRLVSLSWQGSLFILAVALVTVAWRRGPACFKYGLWCLVLVKLLLPVSFSLPSGAVNVLPEPPIGIVSAPVVSFEVVDPRFEWPLLSWVGLAWAVGVVIMLLLLVARYRTVRMWLMRSSVPASPELIALAADLSSRMELRRSVPVWTTHAIGGPLVIGPISPMVFLPEDLFARLEPEERAMLLAHELAHVKRRDTFVAAVEMIALAIHWFNPLAWMMMAAVRTQRELACDDRVVALFNDRAEEYGSGLLKVARFQQGLKGPAFGMAALGEGGSTIGVRVRNILSRRRPIAFLSIPALVALTLVACVMLPNHARNESKRTSQKPANADLDTRVYKIKPEDGPRIHELIITLMQSEPEPPFAPERKVITAGEDLIVRDTPENLVKIETMLLDKKFIKKLEAEDLQIVNFSLVPRHVEEIKSDYIKDFTDRVVEAINTFLYSREGAEKAAAEGRRLWLDESMLQLTIVDTPSNLKQVRDYLASLPELDPNKIETSSNTDATNTEDSIKKDYQAAVALQNAGDPDAAEKAFRKLIEENRMSPLAWACFERIAEIERAQGDQNEALKKYKTILDIYPEYPDIQRVRDAIKQIEASPSAGADGQTSGPKFDKIEFAEMSVAPDQSGTSWKNARLQTPDYIFTADHAEFVNANRTLTLRGNAVVTGGAANPKQGVIFKGDTIIADYRDAKKPRFTVLKSASTPNPFTMKMDKREDKPNGDVEGSGHVVIEAPNLKLTGDSMKYQKAEDTFTVTGNAVCQRQAGETTVFKADQIIVSPSSMNMSLKMAPGSKNLPSIQKITPPAVEKPPITFDRLEIKMDKREDKPNGDVEGAGHVVIDSPSAKLTGDSMKYDKAADTLTVSGNATILQRFKNKVTEIEGDMVVYQIGKNSTTVKMAPSSTRMPVRRVYRDEAGRQPIQEEPALKRVSIDQVKMKMDKQEKKPNGDIEGSGHVYVEIPNYRVSGDMMYYEAATKKLIVSRNVTMRHRGLEGVWESTGYEFSIDLSDLGSGLMKTFPGTQIRQVDDDTSEGR
ncbi:MAG: M56 family metallopeptidase [Candidatus Sumerlaeia bacterium]